MAADLRKAGHQIEESAREVAGMRAGGTDPLHAANLVDRFEQAREVARGVVRRLVVVPDLTEELHFSPSAGYRLLDFGQDVRLATHPLVATRVRHDAEATKFVAPLDDGDVRADRIAAPRDSEREGHIFIRVEIDGGAP